MFSGTGAGLTLTDLLLATPFKLKDACRSKFALPGSLSMDAQSLGTSYGVVASFLPFPESTDFGQAYGLG